ncbi:MAG: hypothetical protein HY553_19275 [Elusimicrobia bacterium]|nr:hypothetical protein [Elusimicrobiota bacterium]
MTRLLLVALLTVPARGAVAPPDAPCVGFGDHTDAIPDSDPLYKTCRSAPLEDPAAFSSAWDRLLAKVREAGGPAIPVEGGELQRGRGRGQTAPASLDEARHWGDVVYVQARASAPDRPVAVFLVTYRATRVGDMLTATRVDFQSGGGGDLRAVHVWHGVKLAGAPSMAWSQGPVSTYNQASMLDGWWTIRYRQLVASWAD